MLALTREQEVTKQKELEKEAAQAAAAAARQQIDVERLRGEEARKTNAELAQQRAQTAKYQDDLNRQRDAANQEARKRQSIELLRLQEESTRKQELEKLRIAQAIEDERRKSEDHRAAKEADVAAARARAEAEGRIKERRANEDVNRRELVLQLEEKRKLFLESIHDIGGMIGNGVSSLLGDRDRLLAGVGAFGGAALFFFFVAREGVRVSGRLAEMVLGQPSLVRETSRSRPLSFLAASRGNTSSVMVTDAQRGFSDVILAPDLKDHLQKVRLISVSDT